MCLSRSLNRDINQTISTCKQDLLPNVLLENILHLNPKTNKPGEAAALRERD